MNVAMSVGLAFAAILGVCLFVLWFGSATVIDKHEDRITVMERRWAEQFGGPEPAAEEVATYESAEEIHRFEPDTDEFPVAPATVPDGMPLVVQSALIERPSPVPRGKSAEWVEEAIKGFNFTGRDR